MTFHDMTAAWVTFLDAMRIPYTVCQKAYHLNGRVFLPELELFSLNLFIKLSPEEPGPDLIADCQAFRWAVGAIFLGVGLPGSPHNRLFCWDTVEDNAGISDHARVMLGATDDARMLFIAEDHPIERAYWCDAACTQELPVLRHWQGWARAKVDGHDFEVPLGVLRSRGGDRFMEAVCEARRVCNG
jgi:hypothetical protein